MTHPAFNQLGIDPLDLSNYRAILIIGDVYRRAEVRGMLTLLFERLRFSHVLVQQSSVCATYAVGVPTACVVDVGAEKTSVCCVEDGVAHAEARVTLAIGRRSVLHAFRRLAFPHDFSIYSPDNTQPVSW